MLYNYGIYWWAWLIKNIRIIGSDKKTANRLSKHFADIPHGGRK